MVTDCAAVPFNEDLRVPLSDRLRTLHPNWIKLTPAGVIQYTMSSICVFLSLNELEQGDGDSSSTQQLCISPPVSSDCSDQRQRAALFLREAEKNRRL